MEPTSSPLYLDYNATTPLDERVFEAMKPWYLEHHGNAGSRTHRHGQIAKEAVDQARQAIASLLDCEPQEVIFTSGATESNNLAILGLRQYAEETGRRHIISTTIEHKAVLEPIEQLQAEGFEVELAPVTSGGYVEADEIIRRLRSDTLLVSVMHSNNETGVLQPVEEIGQQLQDHEALFHIDAAQTFGKEVEVIRRLECDLLSISGHKVYGPKGIGALYVRRRPGQPCPLKPLIYGGGQERQLRPGTLAVPLMVGLGKAAELASAEHSQRAISAATVKETLLADLATVEFQVNGDLDRAQPHVLNISFPGVDSEALMMALRDELAISNGSACTSSSYQPSHVLEAMGLETALIESAVRISWGPRVTTIPGNLLGQTVKTLQL